MVSNLRSFTDKQKAAIQPVTDGECSPLPYVDPSEALWRGDIRDFARCPRDFSSTKVRFGPKGSRAVIRSVGMSVPKSGDAGGRVQCAAMSGHLNLLWRDAGTSR
jgi:hypothetical protein